MASSTHIAGLPTGTVIARAKKSIRMAMNRKDDDPGMNAPKLETTKIAQGKVFHLAAWLPTCQEPKGWRRSD
jgi:hypothetical protein